MPYILVVLFVVLGCAGKTPDTTSDFATSEEKQVEPASIPGFDAKEWNDVVFFENWVKENTPDETKREWVSKCKKDGGSHPFCPVLKRGKYFSARLFKPELVPQTQTQPPAIPELQWKKNTLLNWKAIRNEKVSQLFKAIENHEGADFERVVAFAKRQKCPNNLSAAIAAKWEVYNQPDKFIEAARWYELAAKCHKKKSADREQLLTRAGLIYFKVGQFKKAKQVFSKVTPQDALNGRALYWLARTELALKENRAAKARIERLVGSFPYSFHATLAREQFRKHFKGFELSDSSTPTPPAQKNKKLQRATELLQLCSKYQHKLCEEAVAEFALDTFKKMPTASRLYFAVHAFYPTRIQTLQPLVIAHRQWRTLNVFSHLYPRPYSSSFEDPSEDTALLYAIARKESQFNPTALSIASAYGLMQLQLATAKRFSSDVTEKDLLDPDKNIPLGAKYIKELKQRYNNEVVSVLAAYNAGEEAIDRWKNRYQEVEPILFMDLIPYRETRDYVGYVMSNYYWYRRLYHNDPNPLAAVLPSEAIAAISLD